jgi:hypothetical protein
VNGDNETNAPRRLVWPRIRRLLLLLCVNGAVLAASLAVVELGLRLFAPQVLRRDPVAFNETFGTFYRPKANMEIQVAQPEGVTNWKTNSHGLRDEEIDYIKPAGTYRIIGLGDSFTFGYTVESDECFLHLLEGQLNVNETLKESTGIERFETLNMGVGGYGTVAELNMLQREGIKYEPDLVLLMLFVGNDIEDALRELRRSKAPGAPSSQPSTSLSHKAKKFLGENFHTYSFLSVRLHQLLVRLGLRQINESTVDILRLEQPKRIRQGWTAVEEAISAIHDLSTEVGAEFRVVAIPLRHQVQQSEWQTILQAYSLTPSEYSLDQPQLYLRDMLATQGISSIDLLGAFREQDEPLYNGQEDAHLNPRGHSLTATVIEQEVSSLLQ